MNMGPTTKVGIHLLDDNELVSFLPEERNDTGGDRVEFIPMTEEEDEESNGEGGEATDDGDIKRLCVLFNDAPIAAYMSEKLPKVSSSIRFFYLGWLINEAIYCLGNIRVHG